MKKVTIHYKDSSSVREEVYVAGPYLPAIARQVQEGLEKMGCYDCHIRPAKVA